MTTRDIPRFTQDETRAIEELLIEAGVPFELVGADVRVGSRRGGSEYLFRVPDSRFQQALEVIAGYVLGPSYPDVPYTGSCPACHAALREVRSCTECGLNFCYDPLEDSGRSHPFIDYLKENHLVEKDDPGETS